MVPPTPQWLRRFTKLVALSTLFLIFAGAMVTSTGSGLAVPDWPLSYGMLMPPMVAGILFEHGHRLIAASVGFLVVIQAIWLQLREPKRFVRILGWTSLGAVLAQGLLGGLTVLFLLPHAISIAHAGLAEIFFCINVSIAFFTSKTFLRMREQQPLDDAPVGATTALVLLVYCQILAGALVRHLGAGLAIPDFPLSFGRVVPVFTTAAIAANFTHRFGALLVTIAMIIAVPKAWKCGGGRLARHATGEPPVATQNLQKPLIGFAILVLAVVAVQIFLGAEVVWSGTAREYHSLAGNAAMKHAAITSFHVMTGAATLASSLLLALATRSVAKRNVTQEAGAFVASEVAA